MTSCWSHSWSTSQSTRPPGIKMTCLFLELWTLMRSINLSLRGVETGPTVPWPSGGGSVGSYVTIMSYSCFQASFQRWCRELHGECSQQARAEGQPCKTVHEGRECSNQRWNWTNFLQKTFQPTGRQKASSRVWNWSFASARHFLVPWKISDWGEWEVHSVQSNPAFKPKHSLRPADNKRNQSYHN